MSHYYLIIFLNKSVRKTEKKKSGLSEEELEGCP